MHRGPQPLQLRPAVLGARAERLGVDLHWGRDGSPLRLGAGAARFKAGPLTMPYTPAYVHGRHVIDTYQQIQRYDIGGQLYILWVEAGSRASSA